MDTKTISQSALSVIDQYLHFKMGSAVCSVPYFNNKTAKNKVALRAYKGKGSPREILEESETLLVRERINSSSITDIELKKILVSHNLGIECSGFAYHVLNAECESRGLGRLKKYISFKNKSGSWRRIICRMRPVENCDVLTFADDINSMVVATEDVLPGDIIIMKNQQNSEQNSGDRNHILLIHEVSRILVSNTLKISYTHSAAYPEDGLYSTGVRQGYIEITQRNKPLSAARWVENNLEGFDNRLYLRAQKSLTEVRRLRLNN